MKNNRGCTQVALIPKEMEINKIDAQHTHRAICVMHIMRSSQESIRVRATREVDILFNTFPDDVIDR
jgi:hypothetical protein